MKFVFFLVIFLINWEYKLAECRLSEEIEDNEFAEFEDFEEDEGKNEITNKDNSALYQPPKEKLNEEDDVLLEEEEIENDEDAVTEDEENEFYHFQDKEEFEGFETGTPKPEKKEVPKITITQVPLHLCTNWGSYYLEMIMIAGLVVYFLNFFAGKYKNNKIANMWYYAHKSLLEENFTLVGDDGKLEVENPGLMKESENLYLLWCSGRTACEGMLVELRLLKRQDLLSVMAQILRPSADQVHIRVDMSNDKMDSFVFCIATKKAANRLCKEMADLSVFCPERKSGATFGVPDKYSVMCETSEVYGLLDVKTVMRLHTYSNAIEYIHLSDQYSGPKQSEDTNVTKMPEVKKVLIFHYNIPLKGLGVQEAIDQMVPLLQFVFYFINRVKRFHLSKEGKAEALKNRLRVKEAFMKTTHLARAEAAAARREEKKRQEKERILQEDDPEKQRKWEEKEMKRQLKRKAPKMKQLKVKAL